ncbi:MAG TPA: hypothetical protein V6D22_25655, partial [Candidatus Obscuribacterales bacterium]
ANLAAKVVPVRAQVAANPLLAQGAANPLAAQGAANPLAASSDAASPPVASRVDPRAAPDVAQVATGNE